MKPIRWLLCLWCCCLLSGIAPAQPEGKFLLRNYPPKIYQAQVQNWAAVQDQRGVMYFGNNDGVLEYDGVNWRLIPVSNRTVVRSLAIDEYGVIYVGAVGEIGYLSPDERGQLQYVSLNSRLPEKDREFGGVIRIHTQPGEVYFQSFQSFIRFKNGQPRVWYPRESFGNSVLLNGHIYIQEQGRGLLTLKGDYLQLLKGTEKMAATRLLEIMALDRQRLLIGDPMAGLFVYNLNTLLLSPYQPAFKDFVIRQTISASIPLPNKRWAMGSLRTGALILNADGSIYRQINDNKGLQNNSIYALYTDNQQGLWMMLDNGISRVDIHSPLMFWDREKGLKSSVFALKRHLGRLYIGTLEGLFVLSEKTGRIEEVPGAGNYCLTLQSYGNSLLIGTVDGLFELKNGKISKIMPGTFVNLLLRGDTLYFVGGGDFGIMQQVNGRWQVRAQEKVGNSDLVTMHSDEEGNLWTGSYFTGIYKIAARYLQNPKGPLKDFLTHYSTKQGLPSNNYNGIFIGQGRVLAATEKGVYSYEAASGRFVAAPGFEALHNRWVYCLTQDNKGNIWFDSNKGRGFMRPQSGGTYQLVEEPFKRIALALDHSYPIYCEDSLVWFANDEALFCYNKNIKEKYTHQFSALIRRVTIGDDSTLFMGAYSHPLQTHHLNLDKSASLEQPVNQQALLPFKDNSLTFHYAAPCFYEENTTEYSYRLEGYEEEWSEWSRESKKEYTNLYEGSYVFRVKARNVYGHIGREARYAFVIQPPWFRSWWALACYVFAAILLVLGAARLNARRLIRENEKLDHIVKTRTREVVQQSTALAQKKREVELQKQELELSYTSIKEINQMLENKSQKITDSIQYAQRLQKAILPPVKEIEEVFPDAFVFFSPRDVVSGDFYYFVRQEQQVIIAAVDCTGHGVPGAFMSMLGYQLLNQIVLTEKIYQPSRILRRLQEGIASALRQERNDAESSDGMDLVLCCIDMEKSELHVAAAQNPLWLFNPARPEKMLELKGDKLPIGGRFGRETSFKNYTLPLQENDTIYLFTDGYADQFGGPQNKKFMIKRFRKLLSEIQELAMPQQSRILQEEFLKWKGLEEQVDDVLVMGIRFHPQQQKEERSQLSEKESAIRQQLLVRLHQLEIYDTGEIVGLLNQIAQEHKGLLKWKEALLEAALNLDEEKFRKLLG